MPVIVAVLLGIAVAALARFTRFDEDRSFYCTVLIIIASYYVLFAVVGGSGQALIWEVMIAVVFSTVAILGAIFLPTLAGASIMAHGLFDFVHDVIINSSGVPIWWPTFCGSIELGMGVIILTRSRDTPRPGADAMSQYIQTPEDDPRQRGMFARPTSPCPPPTAPARIWHKTSVLFPSLLVPSSV